MKDTTIEQVNNNEKNQNIVGIYIRSRCENEDGVNYIVDSQTNRLKEYCEKNNIDNIVKYVDIGVSANSSNKPAFNKMVSDIDKGILKKIVVTSPDRLFRDLIKAQDFLNKCISKDVEIIALDNENLMDMVLISELIEENIRQEIENLENDIEDDLEDEMEY